MRRQVVAIASTKSSRKGKHQTKPDNSLFTPEIWKTVYVILCISLIALTAYQFYTISQDPSTGWDYRVFSGAVQSIDHMQNPYVLANINQYTEGANLYFTYPPHTLYFFWILDHLFVFEDIVIYYALLVILLIISGYLLVTLDQEPQYLFLVTLLVTGFMAAVWNFGTGNKDFFFLLLFALIFTLLLKEKYWQSSVLMGLAAAISLITAPFAALYLVVKRPLSHRLAYIILSGGVVASLFVVSYIINPTYLASYIGTLQDGTSSPIYDTGGMMTPTPYLLFGDLLSGVNITGILPVAIVSIVYIGLILYATREYLVNNKEDTLKVYSLVMLAIFMMLPRLKPYDFILAVLPLYFLFKNISYRMKCLMFAVISLPIFFWYLTFVMYTPGVPLMIGVYTQTYSVILVFVTIILYDHWKILYDHWKHVSHPRRDASSK